MDKRLMFRRLKDVKNFKTDKQLADFLGVTPATLCNWKARNTIDFELVFSKFSPNELHFIILGEINENTQNENTSNELVSTLQERIAEQKERIQDLRETNALLSDIVKKRLAQTADTASNADASHSAAL